ncbi:MAG: tRNA (adenosine(37)-N6)-threonylcarbamoyltransferase complex dimerization subunit type 1 TsaB [Alphaproteobacteria bacterium]|nr:tRNA (adenosine(37)-N6)-threonylcarbamoyltransferase complex dimerization subunit type 1 TsaB [Alphaproteobacteria bacterium]
MPTLAINTISGGLSFALARGGHVVAHEHHAITRGHDAQLLPLLGLFLQNNHTHYNQLARVVALRGPGSFTGIRLGLATVLGLSVALNIPALGLNRLHLYHTMPLDVPEGARRVVVLQSRRDELFCHPADDTMHLLTLPQIMHTYGGNPWHLVTDDAALHSAITQNGGRATCAGSAETAASAAYASTLGEEAFARHPATPLYGRAPDVSCGPAFANPIVNARA